MKVLKYYSASAPLMGAIERRFGNA